MMWRLCSLLFNDVDLIVLILVFDLQTNLTVDWDMSPVNHTW